MRKPEAYIDTEPMSAPHRQYRKVIVRPSGAVTKARTSPSTTSSRCSAISPSRCVTAPAGDPDQTSPVSSRRVAGLDSRARLEAASADRTP